MHQPRLSQHRSVRERYVQRLHANIRILVTLAIHDVETAVYCLVRHRSCSDTAVAVMTSLFQAQRAVNLNKIPDLSGKTFLVTGGNTGIGYEVVKALAAKNAHVFMSARNAEKQQGCVTT